MIKEILLRRKIPLLLVLALTFGVLGGLADYLGPAVRVDENELHPPALSRQDTAVSASAPAVSAAGAVLIRADTGAILFEKDAEKRLYPASTTKIMTALVVLEILEELSLGADSRVIVPAEAAGLEGSSIYLKAGEKVMMEELLYGMMLQSGNDAATAAAICAGGNLRNFVARMNRKAEKLGCTGTHFTNACGLFDENHYTTAKDLACIAAAAMQREDFRRIASAPRWQSAESERNFYNKNKTVHQYEGGDGVKIGFTKASGRTLVASATRGDVSLIAVVLRDGNWFADAYAMLDYGFEVTGAGRAAAEKGAQMPS